MEVIWIVLICLDRVLSANVLALRLNPNLDEQEQKAYNTPIFRVKVTLYDAHSRLLPFIRKGKNDNLKQNLAKAPLFKDVNTIERVIDSYLINFEKVAHLENQNKTTLKYSNLDKALSHKTRRTFKEIDIC